MDKTLKILSITGVSMMIAANVIAGFSGGFSLPTFILGGAGLLCFFSITLTGETANLAYYFRLLLNLAFLLGFLVFLYLILCNHNARWDLTKNKQFSLSSQTVQYIKSIQNPIQVTGVTTTPRDMRRFFEQYTALTDFLKVEVRNPFKDFREVQQLKNEFRTEISPGDIFIRMEKRKKKISNMDEASFVNALVEVQREQETVVFFLSGHGEGTLEEPTPEQLKKNTPSYNTLKTLCEQQGMIVKTLELMRKGVVPEEASALVCAGPRMDLFPLEKNVLEKWLNNGGQLICMLDPPKGMDQTFPLFKELFRNFGVILKDDIIMDPNKASMEQYGMPIIPLVTKYFEHSITENIPFGSAAIFLPLSRTINPSDPLPPEIQFEPLLQSSPYSWSQPIGDLFEENFTPPDQSLICPQTLAAAITKTPPGGNADSQARIVLFGDSDIFTDINIKYQIPVYLFHNSLSWLTQRADVVAIPPKVVEDTPLALTAGQKEFLAILLIIAIPSLIFFGGLGFTLIRRRMR